MVRLMIADDEEYERTYLSHFIEENYSGVIRMVYAARDGAELVEKAAELRPDLIMMDIRMPRMDGLEAAAQLKHLLPNTDIVILSAYGEFSYARQAIQLGVKDFLVKPYLNVELEETLNKLLVGRTASAPAAVSDLRELMENRSLDIVWDLAFERRKTDSLRRDLLARGVGEGTLKCLTFYHTGIRWLSSAGREIIRHFFEKPTTRVIADDLLCLLVVYVFSDTELTYSELNTGIRKTREYLTGLDGSPVFCGVSGAYDRLEEAGRAYREASSYIENYSEPDAGKNFRNSEADVLTLCDKEQRLRFFLVNRNDQESRDCLAEQADLLRQYYGAQSETMASAMQRLLFALLRHLLKQLALPRGDEAERLFQICAKAGKDDHVMMDDGLLFLEKIVDQRPTVTGNVQIVKKARDYLDKHYREALSLQSVADILGVSAGYLSKCFKAQGGSSFTEYLTDIRIEAAKKMMRETGESITEISYAVGFSDPGYFSKCFRKKEDITPSEYVAIQRIL